MSTQIDTELKPDALMDDFEAARQETQAAKKAGIPTAAVITETAPATWAKGTDLRNEDGMYQWPPSHLLQPGEVQEFFPSVTTILAIDGKGMYEAEKRFAADYTASLAEAARNGETVPVWDFDKETGIGQTVYKQPFDVLTDKDWMSKAGAREMTRRANRGTIVHDALEEWCQYQGEIQCLKSNDPGLMDWTDSRIQAKGYALRTEEVHPYVLALLQFCEEWVGDIYLQEAPIFNRTLSYAGTEDFICTLKKLPKSDAANFREYLLSDLWQSI